MSQTQTQPATTKSTTPLGVLAATAVTATPVAAPTDKPVESASVEGVTGPDASSVTTTAAATEEATQQARNSRKVFIVVGELHEFESSHTAEKFLNSEGAPKTYAVVRGSRIGTSQKIHLR